MNTVGEILKTARNDQSLSIEEISYELKISKDVLFHFEEDKIMKDYNIIFYLGHLRSYCNYLNLDTNFVIEKYKKQVSFSKIDIAEQIPKPSFQNNYFNFQKYVPAGLILIIFSTFYILFIRENERSLDYALVPDLPERYIPIVEEEDLNISQELQSIDDINKIKKESFDYTSAQASKEINKIDLKDSVTLRMLNATWLQLRDESNNIIISQLMDKDEEYTYQMQLNYNVTAGNAGNVLVIINKDIRGKIGKYGEVVDSFIIDNNFKN